MDRLYRLFSPLVARVHQHDHALSWTPTATLLGLNASIALLLRLLLPMHLTDHAERAIYIAIRDTFPMTACPAFPCYRILAPLLTRLWPLPTPEAFMLTGLVLHVLNATLLWHLYIFMAFGAICPFAALGFNYLNKKQRAWTLASLGPMIFLALYQAPDRALALFLYAVALPASAALAWLPFPLLAGLLLLNGALSVRMATTVPWLPPAPSLLVALAALTAVGVAISQRASRVHSATLPS